MDEIKLLTEHSQPVIENDHDDIFSIHEVIGTVQQPRCRVEGEVAARNNYHYR